LVAVGLALTFLTLHAARHHDRVQTMPVHPLPEMRTACVGRSLIDLPVDFQLLPDSEVDLIYALDKNWRKVNVKLLQLDAQKKALRQVANARAAELSKQYHSEAPTHTMLAATRDLGESMALIRAYDNGDLVDVFRAEVYVQAGPAIAVVSRRIYASENPDTVEAKLIEIAKDITYAEAAAVAGKGTCLGPLVINAGQDGEWLNLAYRSASMKDVVLEIETNSTVQESDGGLLARVQSRGAMAQAAGLAGKSKTLRKGRIEMEGRPAEELLDSGMDGENQDQLSLYFAAETVPAASSIRRPNIRLTLRTGGQDPDSHRYLQSSLSETEGPHWWDVMIKSLRTRNGAT
jgi:hypothetical protein